MLSAAGLALEQVRAEAIVQTPKTRYATAAILRAMLPRIEQHGVATASEIDVDTLDERLAEEREKANATYVSDVVFGAWARKPAWRRAALRRARASWWGSHRKVDVPAQGLERPDVPAQSLERPDPR